MKLETLLGDYPSTRALRNGTVTSDLVELVFDPEPVPNRAFRRTVRELAFDVSELAIATFLQAKALGSPLVLLPATVLGRLQHARLVYNPERGPLAPADLAGRRVGIRAYSVTTAMWIRGVLAHDHGVDLDTVRWLTFEDAHVAGYSDPPSAQRAPPGSDLRAMVESGELDAAVLGAEPPQGSPLRPLIPDPDAAARSWCRRTGAVPVNHLVVVDGALARSRPDVVREVYRLLAESRRGAAPVPADGPDLLPFGADALRPSLDRAIDYASEQGLLARRLGVDELFDDTTRSL